MSRASGRRRIRQRGISLPELLVVVSVIGMAVAVAVPLVSGAILSVELRTATDQFRVTLQAARMIAVSKQAPLTVRVFAHPENRYEYEDSQDRTRVSRIPQGVCIHTATSDAITFQANGSLGESATTIFTTSKRDGVSTVCELGGGADSFTVTTSVLGDSSVTHN